jgi:hypothetical protein
MSINEKHLLLFLQINSILTFYYNAWLVTCLSTILYQMLILSSVGWDTLCQLWKMKQTDTQGIGYDFFRSTTQSFVDELRRITINLNRDICSVAWLPTGFLPNASHARIAYEWGNYDCRQTGTMAYFKNSSLRASSQPVPRLRLELCFSRMVVFWRSDVWILFEEIILTEAFCRFPMSL